jgi:hypothetical protein
MTNDLYVTVLCHLARHKFLTRSLFWMLGLKASRNHFTKIMRTLSEKEMNLIGQKKFWYNPQFWKVEDVYFLKPKGKKYLIREHWRDPSEVNLPIWWKLFHSDYFHRIETIRIRIQIEKALEKIGHEVLIYDQYFAWKVIEWKKWRQAATNIPTERGVLKADSIFLTLDRKLRPYLYCLEYHNWKEVKRIEAQMKAYVEAIKIWSPSIKYDVSVGNRVLNIFKSESVMKCLIERMQQDIYFQNVQEHFLFNTLEEFQDIEVLNWWYNLSQQAISIFWTTDNLC